MICHDKRMRILGYKDIDRAEWKALVASSTTGTWFQTQEAFDFYASQPNLFKPFVVGVTCDPAGTQTQLRAICVGYVTVEKSAIKQMMTKRAIIIGGPALAGDATNEEVEALMMAVRKELNGESIYVESRNFNDYSRWKNAFAEAGFSYVPHLNFHIDTSSMHIVDANLGKSRKRDIRTTIREGVTIIEHPTDEQVCEYYKVLDNLYRTKVKTPLFPLSFFLALNKHKDGRLLLMEYQGRIIGGTVCVEQADQMLLSRQFTVWKVVPVLLIAAAIFTVRTPLGIVALLSLVFSVVMSSSRVVSWGKRVIVGILAISLIGVTMSNQIQEQSRQLFNTVQSGQQQSNMEWRGKRDNGNAFAKYAGKSVFAPLIFTIPFPSMVRPFEGQDVQQLLNGGNFVKNIISGFTIIALVVLLISGKWREHLLPLSFMLGYIVVLTMSAFAQSERFHQPVMPFEMMFAAYGLTIALTKKKYKRWFLYWCGLMFIACIAWNWFKMAGRGLA